MAEANNLRLAAREIFDSALASVDAGKAVRRVVKLDGDQLRVANETFELAENAGVYVIAIGKAAAAMAAEVNKVLGSKVDKGVLSCPRSNLTFELENALRRSGFQTFAAGHPLPNTRSIAAAYVSMKLLRLAEARGSLVIFLISGGGSAMMEFPIHESVSLEDLIEANQQLISCGASISEINSVRRRFSAVKGGRLAALAPRAKHISLIISDTNEGQEADVASGPTLEPSTNDVDPNEVIDGYGLRSTLPPSILKAVESKQPDDPSSSIPGSRHHLVLLDNQTAMRSAAEMAQKLGFQVEIAKDISEQDVVEGSQLMLSRLDELKNRFSQSEAVCLISGGEFSCPVRGDGLGGRNSETVLRCAIEIDKNSGKSASPKVVLSAGTDGIDGKSPAAGAIADESTVERARALGLVGPDFLERSDSFRFFNILGDTITTGTTGTNVRDLRILLTSS